MAPTTIMASILHHNRGGTDHLRLSHLHPVLPILICIQLHPISILPKKRHSAGGRGVVPLAWFPLITKSFILFCAPTVSNHPALRNISNIEDV